MRLPCPALLSLLALLCCPAVGVAVEVDPLARLRWLVGEWEGVGEGVSLGSKQRREVLCALECRHLNVESQSITAATPASPARDAALDGPMPAALGMWTVDASHRRLVLHTFDSQASVTSYAEVAQRANAAAVANRLVVMAQWRPGRHDGWRARFSYHFQPPDTFHERFEVARAGGAWELVAAHTFRRRTGTPAALRPG